jgi:hypothetical protein
MQKASLIAALQGTQPKPYMAVDRQTAGDIMREMMECHNDCKSHYDRIYQFFEGGDIVDICYRLWKFCRTQLTYEEEDVNVQNVSCPYTILTYGKVDCKNYALFIGGVIDAMKRHGLAVVWNFRYASYELWDPIPGHVFIVVNPNTDDIWVDPVLPDFNNHLFYWYKKDKRPKASQAMAGIGRLRIGGRIGSAESDLLGQLLQYQQGVQQAIQLSQQTNTLNTITEGILKGASTFVPGVAAALAVLKLIQVPLNNAFGVGSAAARVYSDITSFNFVGLFNDVFNGRTYNSDQYWGAAFYYWYVKGQDINNQDKVTDAMVAPALQWFIDRTGVFISGRQHIMGLIAGASTYMGYAKANTDTTTNAAQVIAAVKVAQTYWKLPSAPNENYATFDGSLKGSWANTVGVFDTGLAQIAQQYGETAETYAAQTGDAYATNENAGLPATATTDTDIIPGVPNLYLYIGFAGILVMGLLTGKK